MSLHMWYQHIGHNAAAALSHISGIREHGWFLAVAWEALLQRKVSPPRSFPVVEEIQKEQTFNLPGAGDDGEDLYAAEFADF